MTKGVRGRPIGSRTDGNAGARERLLSAALELFGTLGYHEANIRRIGDRAGVDHTLVFRYFDSKALLFAAVVSYALDNAWAAPDAQKPGTLLRLARLMLAAAYAPAEVRRSLVAAVTKKIDAAPGSAGEGEAMNRCLGDAVCQQLAHLLLTLREGEASDTAVLTARLYDHLGRVVIGVDVAQPTHTADPL